MGYNVSNKYLYLVVFVVYACAISVLGDVLRQHMGFPLDDSWIHQSVGRNFAYYGSLGYLPHQRSAGSTSLLWTILLAANYKFMPHLQPVIYTLAINSFCLLAIGVMLLRAALSDGVSPLLALLWAVAPALDGNFVWLAFTGMEHLLFVALSLSSMLLWLALVRGDGAPRSSICLATGLSMGLLGMTRPEGSVLVLLLLTGYVTLRGWKKTQFADFAMAGLAVALTSVPFAINLLASRSLLPLTLKGRRFLYFTGHGSALRLRLELFEQWVMRPLKAVGAVDGQQIHGLVPHLALLMAFAAVAGLWGLGLFSLIRGRRQTMALICGWGVLHSMLYMIILPSSGHGGRYQTFLLLLSLPLLAVGVTRLLDRWPVAAPVLAAAMVAAVGYRSISLWRRVLVSGIDHINGSHGVAADWADSHLPGQPMAVFDIGRIGYQRANDPGNDAVVDLGGLTDAAYLPYLLEGRVPYYLSLHKIHYAVFPVDEDGRSVFLESLHLEGNPEVRRTLLFRACSAETVRYLSWIETRNASPCQEVDELAFQ